MQYLCDCGNGYERLADLEKCQASNHGRDIDHEIILAIQELLDGVEWTPDTLECIAGLLQHNGYPVRDCNGNHVAERD